MTENGHVFFVLLLVILILIIFLSVGRTILQKEKDYQKFEVEEDKQYDRNENI